MTLNKYTVPLTAEKKSSISISNRLSPLSISFTSDLQNISTNSIYRLSPLSILCMRDLQNIFPNSNCRLSSLYRARVIYKIYPPTIYVGGHLCLYRARVTYKTYPSIIHVGCHLYLHAEKMLINSSQWISRWILFPYDLLEQQNIVRTRGGQLHSRTQEHPHSTNNKLLFQALSLFLVSELHYTA